MTDFVRICRGNLCDMRVTCVWHACLWDSALCTYVFLLQLFKLRNFPWLGKLTSTLALNLCFVTLIYCLYRPMWYISSVCGLAVLYSFPWGSCLFSCLIFALYDTHRHTYRWDRHSGVTSQGWLVTSKGRNGLCVFLRFHLAFVHVLVHLYTFLTLRCIIHF